MTKKPVDDSIPVPDAQTEKDFLVNALEVWCANHGKPVPTRERLQESIIYTPHTGNEEKVHEEDWIDVDGG